MRGVVPLVHHSHPEKGVGIQRAPVARISPHPAHAFPRVEHEAERASRPRLRRRNLANRPLHPRAVHHDVGILLIGRSPARREHMTIGIDTPGHQTTYGCAAQASSFHEATATGFP